MGLKEAGSDFEEQPVIPEEYYWGTFEKLHAYERDEEIRLNLIFRVEHEGEEVEVVFNTSNILSMYGDDHSSKLGHFIEDLDLEEVVDEAIGADGSLADGSKKFVLETDEDEEILRKALKIALSGKKFKLNIVREEDEENGERNFIDRVSDWEQLNPGQKSEEKGKGGAD